jgi:hypothetical protein
MKRMCEIDPLGWSCPFHLLRLRELGDSGFKNRSWCKYKIEEIQHCHPKVTEAKHGKD